MQLRYDEVLQRIIKEKDISIEEIDQRVEKKLKELNELVSREGAIHIVAHELGVKLFENFSNKTLKIKDIMGGMRSVNITGKVLRLNSIINYKKENREGKVANFLMGDETGIIRTVFWDTEHIKEIENGNLKEGDILRLNSAYVKENNGFKELHFGNKGSLIINPENVEIRAKELQEYGKKSIKDLKENESAEIFGTIVQLFEPRFYDTCERCGKKVLFENGKYVCNEHGIVTSKKTPILNLFLDDGSSSIRVVCFRNQAERLLNLKSEEIGDRFEEVKSEILGKQISFSGRANKNVLMDRIEFIAQRVNELNPKELANELMKEISI